MKNIEKNLKYIKEVKAEDIEWTKLFGAYSCGRKIGEDIKNNNLLNLEILKNIRGESLPHHIYQTKSALTLSSGLSALLALLK